MYSTSSGGRQPCSSCSRCRRFLDASFTYLTQEGADNWDRIANDRSDDSAKGINSVEGRLLQAKVDSFLGAFAGDPKLNIIDIGCGNGLPVMPLLEALRQHGATVRYVPVDISQEMLDLASATVRDKFPEIEVKQYVIDFDLGNFADMTYELRADGRNASRWRPANACCSAGRTSSRSGCS